MSAWFQAAFGGEMCGQQTPPSCFLGTGLVGSVISIGMAGRWRKYIFKQQFVRHGGLVAAGKNELVAAVILFYAKGGNQFAAGELRDDIVKCKFHRVALLGGRFQEREVFRGRQR